MIESVLCHYAGFSQTDSIECLGNAGGFSGAQLWKAKVGNDFFCIRRWPKTHPLHKQLYWMHWVLLRAVENDCPFVPAPVQNDQQQTFVTHGGYLWEITPWMPGEADLATNCTDAKVEAAFSALAKFHSAVEPAERSEHPSEGVHSRLDFANRLIGEMPEMASRVGNSSLDGQTKLLCTEIVDLARDRLPMLPDFLQPVVGKPLPLQPVIRDIWHQHVLFQDDQVTGIVDFGAMREETVALDFARLLASLPRRSQENRELQPIAINAYTRLRTLSELEIRTMVALLNVSNVLSGLTWVRWLAMGGRTFEDMENVRGRLAEICLQLQR